MRFSRRLGLAEALALIAVMLVASVAGAASTGAVSIVDKSFQPTDLTINVGDTVTWTVTQAIADPHTVTSGTLGGADQGKLFDSGLILKNNGDHFDWTFTAAGTFPYFCTVHPAEMKGTITVTGAGGSGAPAASAPASASAAASVAASAAPAESGAPAASGPAASPTEAPIPGTENPPVTSQDKLTAAGILFGAIVLLFGAAAFYRRFNKV
jgi:plastocyanin